MGIYPEYGTKTTLSNLICLAKILSCLSQLTVRKDLYTMHTWGKERAEEKI
jgi:hypothetical protein